LSDIREENIQDIGYVFLEDEESGEQILVNTSDETFRNNYKQAIINRNKDLQEKMNKLKVDLVQINTSEPFHVPIMKFFKLRERRMVR
jgi:hypothetical protein